MDDGGYLGAYKRFFIDFIERMNPDDQLPVKMAGHDVTDEEIVGEIIDMTLQYLNQKYCPPSLQSHLVHVVIEEMQTIRRQQPESCGLKSQDNTYAPLRFMQTVTGKVNEVCKRYLENSRLALLPPPPSTPLPIVTVCAIKNSRRKMEDRHVVLHDLNAIFDMKDECANYYAVFDGHAGQDAAVYGAAHLHQYLCDSVHYPTDMERALRDAFVTTDAYFVQKSMKHSLSSGTTAVCVLIFKRKLYVAWAGDSQAALAKRGIVTQLVNPHRPDRNDERDRVEKMGGTVLHYGMWRVNGHLAVSRAIGDAQYKPYVTADPEVRTVILDGTEDFLIIACDGLWDFVDEKAAASVVYQQVCRDPYNHEAVSQHLVDYSKSQGSTDNITAIVVFLTSPSQIAARSIHTHPLLVDVHLDNMDGDNRYLSNANGGYEMQTNYDKQVQSHTNGSNFDGETSPFLHMKSSNGKNKNGSIGYDDDDDDLGPETDVDAVDDASEINTLANVSRELFPDKDSADNFSENNIIDDDSPMSPSVTKPRQNELRVEPENVVDSEDSDDEWNYYKIDPNKEEDSNNSESSELKVQPESVDDKLLNQEISKLQQEETFVSEKEQQQQLEDNEIDSCSDCDAESEQEVCSNEPINSYINEIKIEETVAALAADANSEDMDFQLNPDAAEFVPVSPIIPSRLIDRPIAGSPLKKTPMMDDIRLPSPKEFSEEADHRPHEVEGKDDMINSSNGDFTTSNEVEVVDKQKLLFNLDDSEVSSTRAEFGDESTASFLTTTDYPKHEGMDESFSDMCSGVCDNESMMMSFGPGAFNPLSNPVDLNAVHDLSDTDLCDHDDQTLPKELKQEDWEKGVANFITEEKRDIPSPDVNSELVDLISPESDQPPHSVAFPDHQGNDLLGSSPPISQDDSHINKIDEKLEEVTSEVAAMNLKNEELSEVHCEKELESSEFSKDHDDNVKAESPVVHMSHSDDLLSPASQPPDSRMEVADYSLFGPQSNPSLEHSSDVPIELSSPILGEVQNQNQALDLMSNDNDGTSSKVDVEDVKENILEEALSSAPSVDIFENPLDNKFGVKLADELQYAPENDTEEDTKIAFEDDDGPICLQFDPPTGDPFSRSLSPMPDHQAKETADCDSPVEQPLPVFDTKGALKLSESLQEFTGLEHELSPLMNGDATEKEIQEPEFKVAEPIDGEIFEKPRENTTPPLLFTDECVGCGKEETPIDTLSEAVTAAPEEPPISLLEKTVTTSERSETAASDTAMKTAAAIGAIENVDVAAKPKAAVKSPLKTATKTGTPKSSNKLSPTSPTKALSTTSSRPTSSPSTRKMPISSAARLKPTEVAPKTSPSASKSPAIKSTAKPSPRMNTAPKTKPIVKSSSSITEKKPTGAVTNGEAKSGTTKPAPKSKVTSAANGVPSKSLVKPTMTSTRPTAALTTKSKPCTGSTTSTVGTKAAPNVTSTIGSAARPKTAPATLALTKSRVQSTTKSPVLDKQIKETANKQISSSRTTTTTTATRTSRVTNSSTTATATSTITSVRRSTAATAQAKKPLPTTRMSAKSATAISKTAAKNSSVKTKLQNGVCETKESKVIAMAATTTTITTTTTTNGQDILQKDASPVELATDNQLLITADRT